MDLTLPNQVPNRRCAGHDFQRSHAPPALFLEQSLGDHRFNRLGELSANLSLLIGWKNIDNTIYRFWSARCVQCTKYDMTGFRGGQRELNGFEIAHFADENNIWIFTQRRSQRVGK